MANMGVGNKPLMDIGGSNTITDRSVSVPDNSKNHFSPVRTKNYVLTPPRPGPKSNLTEAWPNMTHILPKSKKIF